MCCMNIKLKTKNSFSNEQKYSLSEIQKSIFVLISSIYKFSLGVCLFVCLFVSNKRLSFIDKNIESLSFKDKDIGAKNSNFLMPISLKPDGVDLRDHKLKLYL